MKKVSVLLSVIAVALAGVTGGYGMHIGNKHNPHITSDGKKIMVSEASEIHNRLLTGKIDHAEADKILTAALSCDFEENSVCTAEYKSWHLASYKTEGPHGKIFLITAYEF